MAKRATTPTTTRADGNPTSSPRAAELLAAARRETLDIVTPLLRHVFDVLASDWFKRAEASDSASVQRYYWDARRELLEHRRVCVGTLEAELAKAFDEFPVLAEPDRRAAGAAATFRRRRSAAGSGDLDLALAVSETVSRAVQRHSAAIELLSKRFALLGSGDPPTEPEIPAGPSWLTEAFVRAMTTLELAPGLYEPTLRAFEQRVLARLERLYSRLNTTLGEAGLLPHLSAEAAAAGEPADASEAPSPTEDGRAQAAVEELAQWQAQQAGEAAVASETVGPQVVSHPDDALDDGRPPLERFQALQQVLAERRHANLSARARSRYGRGAAPDAGSVTLSTGELVTALDSLQEDSELVRENARMGPSTERLKGLLCERAPRAADVGARAVLAGSDEDIIEAVTLMFEYLRNDHRLPEPVRGLLARLYMPYLKVALLDKRFFTQPNHPAQRLLNALAEAGETWVPERGSRHTVYRLMRSVVHRLLSDFGRDQRLLMQLLRTFERYLQRMEARAERAEKRARDAMLGSEDLHAARLRARHEIDKRAYGCRLTGTGRRLLREPWTDVLTLTLMIDGDRACEWRQRLVMADRLATAFDSAAPRAVRGAACEALLEDADRLAGLLAWVGYAEATAEGVLEGLLTGADDVVLPGTPPRHLPGAPMGRSDSLDGELAAAAEKLCALPNGTWFEVRQGEDRHRIKLAWQSTRTERCLFVDQRGGKVGIKPLEVVARALRAGRIRVLSVRRRAFTERALSGILRSLEAR